MKNASRFVDIVDGEATTVHANEALPEDVRHALWRHLDTRTHAAAHALVADDARLAFDMAVQAVATIFVTDAMRSLDIDETACFQSAQRRDFSGSRGNVKKMSVSPTVATVRHVPSTATLAPVCTSAKISVVPRAKPMRREPT